MLTSIVNSATSDLTAWELILCIITSLFSGMIIAFCYMFKSKYSKNFVCTLIVLPVIVQSVIMMVNGNIGTGVAVMGAFGLIRFRSYPGTSRDIVTIFLAMAVGIATGVGQLIFALIITAVVCTVTFFLNIVKFGECKSDISTLKITIPDDMDFAHAFDDIFEKYTTQCKLITSKTVDMGSLFELAYEIILKDENQMKAMIDEIRCRNGNLTIICSRPRSLQEELL